MQHYNMMVNSMRESMSRGDGGMGNEGGGYSMSLSSSSTSTVRNRVPESKTTTTCIVNGKQQTVTETVRKLLDGTVEQNVEMQEDDLALENDGHGDSRER